MQFAHDDRFGGRAPRLRSSEFQVRSSHVEVRSLRFPGCLGQRTWKDNGGCTPGAMIGYSTGLSANIQGSLTSLEKPENAEFGAPFTKATEF
jgi:hypothetical protein